MRTREILFPILLMLDLSASYSLHVYVMLPFTPILPEKL